MTRVHPRGIAVCDLLDRASCVCVLFWEEGRSQSLLLNAQVEPQRRICNMSLLGSGGSRAKRSLATRDRRIWQNQSHLIHLFSLWRLSGEKEALQTRT